MPADEKWLFFVDTNVFLDFYRYPGEPAKRQLAGLLKHKDRLIVTEQLHMEYLKNRQKVIVESLKQTAPNNARSMPSILADSKFGKATLKAEKNLAEKAKKLQAYSNNLLVMPGAYDAVYRTAVKIFNSNHRFNLKRPDETRFEIRERAEKRFILGYPPRKANDTSIGDAINWEWIVHCAEQADDKPNIMIVSRDSDFGVFQSSVATLNDWLKAEFKKRIPGRRKIELTNRLTVALKRLDENVTPADEEIESEVIQSYPGSGRVSSASGSIDLSADTMKLLEDLGLRLRDLSGLGATRQDNKAR